MTPSRAAAGLCIVLAIPAGVWLRYELGYLGPWSRSIALHHWPRIVPELVALLLVLYAGLYRALLATGLGRVGRKLEAEERALERGSGYDRDLTDALAIERDAGGI